MTEYFGKKHKSILYSSWEASSAATFVASLSSTQTTVFNAAAAVDDLSDAIRAKAVTRKVLEYAFDNLRPA